MPGFDRLAFARRVLAAEADAVRAAADRLGASFETLADMLFKCRGRVAVAGVGKPADVGRKIAATLNSTGTRAYVLDVTNALHGDLGMVAPEDVSLVLSHSGESEEILRLLGPLRELSAGIAALTGNPNGTLARLADVAVVYGPLTEACPNALAPSTSTTVMLALGDALAFTLSEMRQFGPADFARFHPAGSLGKTLATVAGRMRSGDDLRLAPADVTVREVFARVRHVGRRTGAVILIHPDGTLAGLFTDSDLARLFERRADAAFDRPIREVMTPAPSTVPPSTRLSDAVELMRARKLSELPVVDSAGRPVGILDITDVIGSDPLVSAGTDRPALRLFDRATG